MKPISLIALTVLLALLAVLALPSQAYKLSFAPSPGESSNTVYSYIGGWNFTNGGPTTNQWFTFGTCLPGTTNITITSAVPSPAYLAVAVMGTNFVVGPFTNVVLYNTNALATIYTNTPPPPPPAGTNNITL